MAWPRSDSNKSILDNSASVNIVRSPAAKAKTAVRGKKETALALGWDDRLIDANIEATLALTLQISGTQMKEVSVVKSCRFKIFMWGGKQPSVLLICIDSTVKDKALLATTVQLIKEDAFGLDADSAAHPQNSLVAIVDSNESSVSCKALMNMAANADLDLEKGLVLFQEASLYAMMEAKVYVELRGHVFDI